MIRRDDLSKVFLDVAKEQIARNLYKTQTEFIVADKNAWSLRTHLTWPNNRCLHNQRW